MEAFNREPCFWTTSNAAETGYNTADREKQVMRAGRKVKIKHPQRGHLGDYDQRMPAPGQRWIELIKSNGDQVYYVITCGAADLDGHSAYAVERRQKARALGWYAAGACPVALLKTGEMVPDHFVDQSLLDAQPCQHGTYSLASPCPHALAEKAARAAAHASVEAERNAAFVDPAQKMINAQREQTAALVSALTSKQDLPAEVVELIKALASKPEPRKGDSSKPGKGE